MIAVIDCGTTNTRIYITDKAGNVLYSGNKKVGVRDTSIHNTTAVLRKGVTDLYYSILAENHIREEEIEYVIASGMITSEIGLIEIPHLVAPVGIDELAGGIVKVEDDPDVLPIRRPIYFVRGIRNHYEKNARADSLRKIDFIRGEEVQCIGIIDSYPLDEAYSIVALSSHTKVMYIDRDKRIAGSITTISGQFYEALVDSSNLGKSIVPLEGEDPGGYGYEELIDIASDCVENAGLGRTMLMPRFMQVLLKARHSERKIFIDAAIATDDMKAFSEMRNMGYTCKRYILYGQAERCRMYSYMLKQRFGDDLEVITIEDKEEIAMMTVKGSIRVIENMLRLQKKG